MSSPAHDDGFVPKIARLENEPISGLLPYSSFIIVMAILVLVVWCNMLERGLLRAVYGDIYRALERAGDESNEKRRRSFVYHHVGLLAMVAALALGVYPAAMFLLGPNTLATPLFGMTTGDALLVTAQVYNAYYIFELCFRTRNSSYIGVAHHFGLLVVLQLALTMSVDLDRNREATVEFYMCLVWGIFDAVAEMPLHIAMIIWRIHDDNHRLRSWLAYASFVWVLSLALAETAITIYLLNKSWHRWQLAWKIATPTIFSLWISAQLYGALDLLRMATSERRKCAPDRDQGMVDGECDMDRLLCRPCEKDCAQSTWNPSATGGQAKAGSGTWALRSIGDLILAMPGPRRASMQPSAQPSPGGRGRASVRPRTRPRQDSVFSLRPAIPARSAAREIGMRNSLSAAYARSTAPVRRPPTSYYPRDPSPSHHPSQHTPAVYHPTGSSMSVRMRPTPPRFRDRWDYREGPRRADELEPS